MTSREESAALIDLRELLASDLSKLPPEKLAEGVRAAELVFDEAQRWSGRLIAELRRRDMSWSEVSELTDVAPTTLRNRVAKIEGE